MNLGNMSLGKGLLAGATGGASLYAGPAMKALGLGPISPTGYSKGDLDAIAAQQQSSISDFANKLSLARQRYLGQIPQFQNYAMSRFIPQIEANFAGRGLQVSGGAFGSELGRTAGDFQAQQMLAEKQGEIEDLTSVQNMRNSLAMARLGGGYQNFAGPQQPNPNLAGLGQFAGALFLNRLNASDQKNLLNMSGGVGSGPSRGSVVPSQPWQGVPYR